MGAVIAYELGRKLEAAEFSDLIGLIPCSRRAPSVQRDDLVDRTTDTGLIGHITTLRGSYDPVFDDPEMRKDALAVLRADYAALDSYRYSRTAREYLTCPISVMFGSCDPYVTPDEANAWEQHCASWTRVHKFPGGHFFMLENESRHVGVVLDEIRRYTIGAGM